ncbi:MAG: Uma2 family endonuclease [Chloroflexia bacterium]|nr:Uma2 family endonuclease [Chloroflexia bacterium]
MSVKHELVTAEELWKVPEVPGKNVELIDGEVVEASPAAMRHGLIVGKLYVPIQDHVQRNAFGSVAGDNVGYVLRRDPDEVRAPDVSFCRAGEHSGIGCPGARVVGKGRRRSRSRSSRRMTSRPMSMPRSSTTWRRVRCKYGYSGPSSGH